MLSGGAFVVGGCFDKVDVDVEKLDVEFNVVIDEKVVFFVGVLVTFEVEVIKPVAVFVVDVVGLAIVVEVEVGIKVFVVVVVVVVVDALTIGVAVVEEVEVVVKVFGVVVVVVVVDDAVVGVKIFKKIHCT